MWLLVREVVADNSERSPTMALPPIADVESVVRDVLDRVAGFGPLQRYLGDPEIETLHGQFSDELLVVVLTLPTLAR